MPRVEAIAESLGFSADLNLTALETSIKSLVSTSESLDEEKVVALTKLRKLLPKPKHGLFSRFRRGLWRVRARCGSHKSLQSLQQMDLWQEPSMEEQVGEALDRKPHMPPIKNIKEIKKVLLQIREINMKLKGFEGGFISEEGIKVSRGLWIWS